MSGFGQVYTTLPGHEIALPMMSETDRAFLDRLDAMLRDPRVSLTEMRGVVFSSENPCLDPAVIAPRGPVGEAALDDPLYQVQQDFLIRKRASVEGLSVEVLKAAFTLTVEDAANELGVTTSAVRNAIAAKRLPSWKDGARHLLDPRHVHVYPLGRNGAKRDGEPLCPPLFLAVGHEKGFTFHAKHLGELDNRQRVRGNVVTGVVRAFKRVGILAKGPSGERFFELTPSERPTIFEHGPFYAHGRFAIAKENNATRAHDAWRRFQAE